MPALSIALPKGRVLESAVELLERAGVGPLDGLLHSRRLIWDLPAGAGGPPGYVFRFVLAKPWDVPTYVEYGAAVLGLAGKDVLVEREKPVAELMDLGVGRCRMVLAVPEGSPVRSLEDIHFPWRVATKYPHVATRFCQRWGVQAEIINLQGSIEVAPLVGLADAIVDITETGTTLRENGLRVIAEVLPISTRLIANPVLHKVHREAVEQLSAQLRQVVQVVDPNAGHAAEEITTWSRGEANAGHSAGGTGGAAGTGDSSLGTAGHLAGVGRER